jgi:hypothetical protein
MIILSTDNLDESIASTTKRWECAGDRGGSGRRRDQDRRRIVKGPYDDAHERRAVVYDNRGQQAGVLQPARAVDARGSPLTR